jgi:hypothetical protein
MKLSRMRRSLLMTFGKIETYEEAIRIIEETGILPLSPLIPEHPSLESVTDKERWYTSTKLDPWLWRARFPGDGKAAYGKFCKNKSILVARELFPLVKAVLGSPLPLEERYKSGQVSKEARELYALIQEEEGIETRSLRSKAGMKAQDMKKKFDKALLELQGSVDIVISGIKDRRNEVGEQNGWNSTSFETSGYWMENAGLPTVMPEIEDAKAELLDRLSGQWSAEAMKWLVKTFRL